MTEIARSYGCTPPAIRYIISRTDRTEVNRVETSRSETRRDKIESGAAASQRADGRATAQVVSVGTRAQIGKRAAAEIWDRVSSDIASFLAGMDAISQNESDENYEALLHATDRLLRSSARTRMEVERILDSRKLSVRRKVP